MAALRETKEHAHLRDVPIFVVTAAQYAGSVPPGYTVWIKPLRLAQLITAIRSYLR